MFKPLHFRLALGIILLGLAQLANAVELPAPEIEWQRSFGGTGYDYLAVVEQAFDGGFILGGRSDSPISETKTAPHWGESDYWIVRLDSNGALLWQKTFGGSGNDFLIDLKETSDHGFILVGGSFSGTNGNKSVPNAGQQDDAWVIRLDQNGNKIWEKTFGGNYHDYIARVLHTDDGGFICLGDSESVENTGNKTSPNFGYYTSDLWVIRLDASGNKLWEKTYGGSSSDNASCLEKTSDGGFILGGVSLSPSDGNKTAPLFGGEPFGDYWIVRVNAQGDKLWDNSFGGSDSEFLNDLKPKTEGGFLLAGQSVSPISGNKTNSGSGAWIVSVDSEGNKQWDKLLAPFAVTDFLTLSNTKDGGFIAGGFGLWGPYGGFKDGWIARTDANGVLLWNQFYGGNGNQDLIQGVRQTQDGGFILAGVSDSGISGNKTDPYFGGTFDWWFLKLKPEQPKLEFRAASPISPTGFQFSVIGISNKYVTEFSTNLFDWIGFQTNSICVTPGEFSVVDSNTNGNRFYRARQLP